MSSTDPRGHSGTAWVGGNSHGSTPSAIDRSAAVSVLVPPKNLLTASYMRALKVGNNTGIIQNWKTRNASNNCYTSFVNGKSVMIIKVKEYLRTWATPTNLWKVLSSCASSGGARAWAGVGIEVVGEKMDVTLSCHERSAWSVTINPNWKCPEQSLLLVRHMWSHHGPILFISFIVLFFFFRVSQI